MAFFAVRNKGKVGIPAFFWADSEFNISISASRTKSAFLVDNEQLIGNSDPDWLQ